MSATKISSLSQKPHATDNEKEPIEKEEAEKQKRARAHQIFQSIHPFRRFPEFGCLSADAWTEPYEAQLEREAQQRVWRREAEAASASRASVEDLSSAIWHETAELALDINDARNLVRRLEDRLAFMVGHPIPYLPPPPTDGGEEGYESSDGWI